MEWRKLMKKRFVVCTLLIGSLVLPAFAGSTRTDDISRIEDSAQVFKEIVDAPDSSFPLDLIQSAACLAIIPGEMKFAFLVGGKYGKGIVMCRTGPKTWSAPAFVMIGGGSFGFQIGGSATDLILVFRNRNGLRKLLSDKFKIGGEATAAAGPLGRNAEASTDLQLHAEILSYSRSRGLFAGISLDGAVFQPDEDGNFALYGTGTTPDKILAGNVPPPSEAAPLLADVSKYALTDYRQSGY
jgi:SH3 domain-containing YSC84-like protein 1